MNFFSKNKVVFWLMIFLIAINLTILITFIVFYSRKSNISDEKPTEKPGMVFSKELSLTSSQSEKVEIILTEYRNSTDSLTISIREYRASLLKELAKDIPDTTVLNNCADEICSLQRLMQKASINQYLELKKICNSDQCQRLSVLYFELYGCQGNGKGTGKGMMHRYRRGQGNP